MPQQNRHEELIYEIDDSLNNLIEKLDKDYSADEYVKCLFVCLIKLAAELSIANEVYGEDFNFSCDTIFKEVLKSEISNISKPIIKNELN
jgi:hypothetical protein